MCSQPTASLIGRVREHDGYPHDKGARGLRYLFQLLFLSFPSFAVPRKVKVKSLMPLKLGRGNKTAFSSGQWRIQGTLKTEPLN